eukprot:CAMPEP_0178377270 /NCGR_PEP_ID=MMETSP0689_2-20121128/3833_1 /TAXON_ID=160604 /ORGANISM="Amphidinium massartii, Strain CS-259" /LENGTH=43 /DNA_ID= /DNA_START= /DNA_END= /DNA_ORIENTATION=
MSHVGKGGGPNQAHLVRPHPIQPAQDLSRLRKMLLSNPHAAPH